MTRGGPLRVLHAPMEIAGQAGLSVAGLRELGVRAHTFAGVHAFRYEAAPDIVPAPGRVPFLRAAAGAALRHDVLHFHYGRSFVRDQLDARMLARLGKRVVVEFHGSDVRMPSVERARNPWYVQLEGETDEGAAELLERWPPITRGHVVQCDHSLDVFTAPHFEHVHVVGHRVDTRRFAPAPPKPDARVPVIVHSPSDRAAKGTVHVRRAVAALQARGAELEYVEVHGVGQREARAAYARADLVIDQLCAGTHGVFAVEAMALAKPVVCFMAQDLLETFPADLPIINADPDTVERVLGEWLERPAERHRLGIRSRAYAERRHDIRVVARRLLDVYDRLGS